MLRRFGFALLIVFATIGVCSIGFMVFGLYMASTNQSPLANLRIIHPAAPVPDRISRLISEEADDPSMDPIHRVNPDYPEAAAMCGIQGWVAVSYSITSEGGVVDPSIIESYPEGFFDAAVLKAIAQWKYAPASDNGAPTQNREAKVLIRLQLDE
jgi:TonB family protein